MTQPSAGKKELLNVARTYDADFTINTRSKTIQLPGEAGLNTSKATGLHHNQMIIYGRGDHLIFFSFQVSYSVLDVIAGKSWGLTRLAAHPGLIEYLLDRSQLRSKEAKDARFDLNKTITTNPNAEQVLQPQNLRRLKQYIRDGPYHVEAQVEVALDEGA